MAEEDKNKQDPGKAQNQSGAQGAAAQTQAKEDPNKGTQSNEAGDTKQTDQAPKAGTEAKAPVSLNKADEKGRKTYVLKSGKHRYRNDSGETVVAVPGDDIPLTDTQAANFADRVKLK